MDPLKVLQHRFFQHEHVSFEQLEHDVIVMRVDHPQATATVSLDGGQVLAWQPKSQAAPVLWSTESAQWRKGRAIRAGVPICWPWFGSHPTQSEQPSHGYARVCEWDLLSISTLHSGALEINLTMIAPPDSAMSHVLSAKLSVCISIGETLSIALTTTNTGEQTICLTEALHAYFNVGAISKTHIEGLNGSTYVDLIDRQLVKTQNGVVKFSGETGRVYINTESDCLIIDRTHGRSIKIEKTGSQSTVIWNPGLDTASKMDDLGPVAWQKMVCVESANALDNKIILKAGDQHTLAVRYSVDA
jgi:D-hexose-6-phosphate mutarotase